MKIEAKRGKAEKMHIMIDGEYSFTTCVEFWYTCGFSSEKEIDEDSLEELKARAAAEFAYSRALNLLSLRDHSRYELATKLRDTAPKECVEKALDRLELSGLIDDNKYAVRAAESLLRRKHMSGSAIKFELIKRGIDKDTAQEVCNGLEIDEKAAITELLKTKFAARQSTERDRQRTFNSLLRLGYAYGDIRSAIRTMDE